MKCLTLQPQKPSIKPEPGSVVLTAEEALATFNRIVARLNALPALLDERTKAHFAMNQEYLRKEAEAKRRRKGLK